MRFSSIFGLHRPRLQLQIAPDQGTPQLQIAPDSSPSTTPKSGAIPSSPELSGAIRPKNNFRPESITQLPTQVWLLPTQALWINDLWPLRIWEKSRQVGATKTDALDSVLKVSPAGARFDVWVSSRDECAACLYLEDCREWAKILNLAATYLGRVFLDRKNNSSAYVLQFANGRRIYCLSSNPNAFAGKRGHVKLDEFALHDDQRLLYKVAKPVTQWGGTFSIISTHRGPNTLFNQIICQIRRDPAASPWHLYTYPLQTAIAEGLVERINEKSGRSETREQFENRTHAECIDEDQWHQEYCCIPADETTAFLTHDMITACEDPSLCLLTYDQLIAWLKGPDAPNNPELYLGVDVARKKHLCVMDLGLKVGGIMYDKLRIELHKQPFPVIEAELHRLLRLPQLRRACIDENGNGMQLAEEARLAFGPKAEAVHITGPVKEKIAFGLRNDFESLVLKIQVDPHLRADLHGIKKQITAAGNIRLDGDTDDSHCDRFWAKALRQEAARPHDEQPWSLLG